MKIGWLIQMAWRDSRASGKKLLLFTSSIIFGIAAFVAIQSFGESLKDNMALQSKTLMGADFKIDTDKPPENALLQMMDSLGGYEAREVAFPSMAAFSSVDATKFMRVRGIEGAFPFYGILDTSPPEAGSLFGHKRFALVDETVMLQYDLQPGDSIKLGYSQIVIGGALKSIPGSNAIFSSIAPPVVVPYDFIAETQLIQTGSRIDYEFYFKTSPETDLAALDKSLDPKLDALDADIDTHTSTSERLGRRYENFGKFLNLVAFIALLLGCIGIASAVQIYIREKIASVAVLKCLGASNRQAFAIFLIQIAGIGWLGGIIGTLSGLAIQYAFPLLLKGLLPIEVAMRVHPQTVVGGLLLGLIIAVLFSLNPLLKTYYASPLQALRIEETTNSKTKKLTYMVASSILAFMFLMSWFILGRLSYSLFFLGGIVATFIVLAGISKLLTTGLQRFFPTHWPFVYRQSLKNLFRPHNQTLILLVAIGLGSFLVSTLYFSRSMLLAQAEIDAKANKPNLILLDVQTSQVEKAIQTIKNQSLEVLDRVPIVTMRMQELKGKSVNEWRKDTTDLVNNWTLDHEYRVTYRDSLTVSEKIIEGEWKGEMAQKSASVPISISSNFAEAAKLKVGDSLTFNVQGLLMNTQVASIREVDWGQVQLNFLVLFPKGVLEEAPQFWVMSTFVPDEKQSAALQQRLVRDFPNVSLLDLRQILNLVEGILDKITWLINFMALFCILTALVVLLGAVKTSKYQRLKENVLLRTVGASGRQIFKILFSEYFLLGLLGSLSGIVLALLSGQMLALFLFETVFVPPVFAMIILISSIIFLVTLIGVTNSYSAVKSPPLLVLRREI